MHLSLENETSCWIQFLGDTFGLLWSCGDVALLHQDTILSHNVLALILVQVEEPFDGFGEAVGSPAKDGSCDHQDILIINRAIAFMEKVETPTTVDPFIQFI